MSDIYLDAYLMFDKEGYFEIEFVGEHAPRLLHIIGVNKTSHGDFLQLLAPNGLVYNWANVISAKRMDL